MTYMAINHADQLKGATAVPPLDFDWRPIAYSMDRIAAACEKIQLVVNIPEMNPHIDVTHPEVNVEVKPAMLTPTIQMPESRAQLAPIVTVVTPWWPTLVLVIAALIQIGIALGWFTPKG